jgi:hypothetical protein
LTLKGVFVKKLTVFFKQLQVRQILTIVLATVVLFVGTACNSGDVRGARPDNPPVQAGGANNPYKGGGDTNTNFNISPDPKVNSGASRNRADLNFTSNQLIATSDQDELLYPGSERPGNQPGSQSELEKSLPKINLQDFETPAPGGENQRNSDVGERLGNRLEAVKEAFSEATDFIGEGASESAQKAGLERQHTTSDAGQRR